MAVERHHRGEPPLSDLRSPVLRRPGTEGTEGSRPFFGLHEAENEPEALHLKLHGEVE